jgi:radical SAM protein with 4Fe4S-binding SPASM domain
VSDTFVSVTQLPRLPLWERRKRNGGLISFTLEFTARCNNNCRHCFINVPAEDRQAKKAELSLDEIERIVDEAVSMGAMWCLVTGGEPLLRPDFEELYLMLKKKGLLVSLFTNATLVTKDHIRLFRHYPPRAIEVTVYGINEKTYERVSRSRGNYDKFAKGLGLLQQAGIGVQLKTMALRSNYDEISEISMFCRQQTKGTFRFDPFLHLRYDGDSIRNEEIKSERLFPDEIVALERSDPERFAALKMGCDKLIKPISSIEHHNHLFRCGIGYNSFTIGSNGLFRLCESLWHPEFLYDLRAGTVSEAFDLITSKVRAIRSNSPEFIKNCAICSLVNLCIWCPAHAHLETGKMDACVDYFCENAFARSRLLIRHMHEKKNHIASQLA